MFLKVHQPELKNQPEKKSLSGEKQKRLFHKRKAEGKW